MKGLKVVLKGTGEVWVYPILQGKRNSSLTRTDLVGKAATAAEAVGKALANLKAHRAA